MAIRQAASVSIIMGSINDKKVMSGAMKCLKQFHVPFEVKIVSAHRTPEFMQQFALEAQKRGIRVIIAGAGGAAHLPGMVASLTTLPVIGVPVLVGKLKGLDALLSIAQMPKGIPVATVAVDNSFNAGLLATQILSISDKGLDKKVKAFRQRQKTKVLRWNKK